MDLDNCMALQALVYRLHKAGDEQATAAERSTGTQVLGAEIERRALALIAEVRAVRGYEEEAPAPARIAAATNGSSAPPVVEDDGKLNGAKVRDSMMKFKTGFTLSELVADVRVSCPNDEVAVKDVRKFVDIWASNGSVRNTMQKIGREFIFEYVPPQGPPVNREKRLPPERSVDPAFTEARATGLPVRVPAMARLTRQGRSTGGLAHFHRQRDARYETMQKAQAQGARKRASKAESARMNGNGSKKKK